MIGNKKKPSAPFCQTAFAALFPLLAASSAIAAENHFLSNAPFAQSPLAPPPSQIVGEIRIPAARPPAAGPAYANNGEFSGAQVRLRLRPVNFGGL